MESRNVQILFPVNVPEPFDYAVPPHLKVSVGDFVVAPIGKQMKIGVVWGEAGPSERTLKEIVDRKATRALPAKMIDFVNWVSRYNVVSAGLVLRMVIRSYKALEPSAEVTLYRPKAGFAGKITPSRRKLLDEGGPFPARASEIAQRSGISAGVVKGFEAAGGLVAERGLVDPPFGVPDPDFGGHTLTAGQKQAARELEVQVKRGGFSVSLLDGVTGSGKTEVYFEAAAEAIRQGGQVLVLVPEIALTQASLRRFKERFGVEPAPWHSALGDAARRRTWREVAQGRAQLVIGARSALFLPYPNLKALIIDEEHDSSYKQEEGVIYNARDMAVVRGKVFGHAVILASATPTLESFENARQGRYAHIILPERPGAVTLPPIKLVDLKENPPESGHYISEPLIQATRAVLDKGEQALFYLNRRGYAPLIICRACGEKLRSPDTDSWLVEHRATGRARCHYTGFSMPMPRACPQCKTESSLTSVGPGVERVAEEAAILFPDARIEVFSSDTAGNPDKIADRMRRMANGDIDILVGTQMVVKGHNFPHLTFVGVVDGDLSLAGGDMRAGERTYQTLVQVAGRAGRADKPGTAMIQTHQPEHEALIALAAGDRSRFIEAERDMRNLLGLPPFGKLASIIMSGPDHGETAQFAKDVVARAPRADGIEISGPSEAPISRLRGRFRQRLLIQANADVSLSQYMAAWKRAVKTPPKYKFQVDIDPQNFM